MLASCFPPDHEQNLFEVRCFGQCIRNPRGVRAYAAAAAAIALHDA
jgi:hypothetical protein